MASATNTHIFYSLGGLAVLLQFCFCVNIIRKGGRRCLHRVQLQRPQARRRREDVWWGHERVRAAPLDRVRRALMVVVGSGSVLCCCCCLLPVLSIDTLPLVFS